VVLLPAEAEEHPDTVRLSNRNRARRRAIPLAIFWADLHFFSTQLFEVVMRLSCQKAFLLLAVSLLACRDSTANVAMPPRLFILNDINGRVLPTYMVTTPGLTPTIVSGTLTLDPSGHASMSEHRIEFNGVETDNTANYTYKITGGTVQFEMLGYCPGTVMCAGPPKGTISTDGLRLTINLFGSNTILYDYSLVPNLALRDR
jgi:hypothetical protein